MRNLHIFLLDSRLICESFHMQELWVGFLFHWALNLQLTGDIDVDAQLLYLQYLARERRLPEFYSLILDLQKLTHAGRFWR